MFADVRTEWRVAEIEQKLSHKAESYEISKISGNLDSLECSLREARAETSELRYQLSTLQEAISQLQEIVRENFEGQP